MTSSPSVIKARERGVFGRPKTTLLIASSSATLELEAAPPSPEEVAARTLTDAREEAAAIVAEANSEAHRIREDARQAGYSAGEQAGEADWRDRLAGLDEQGVEVLRRQDDFYIAAEAELAKLSIEIARKILKQEITQNPEAVMKVVRAAIRRVRDKDVRVLVNPADLDTVRGGRDSLLGIADGVSGIEIVSDRRVGQGGCVLETASGSVDARIETQLTHISEMLDRETDDEPKAPHSES